MDVSSYYYTCTRTIYICTRIPSVAHSRVVTSETSHMISPDLRSLMKPREGGREGEREGERGRERGRERVRE